MNISEAKDLVTRVLITLGHNSPTFVNLLTATLAQESDLGLYERQVGGGPARGIMQMENATFQDINHNFLAYRPDLNEVIQPLLIQSNPTHTADDLVGNHEYAVAYAACSYLRHHAPDATVLPNDVSELYRLYKTYYNGPGAATAEQFTAHCKGILT